MSNDKKPEEIKTKNTAKPFVDAEAKNKLREKAREMVRKEQTEKEEDALLEAMINEERIESLKSQGLYSEDEIVSYVIDLAPHSDAIILDGVRYFHGTLYQLPRKVYDTIREIAARTWDHENETGGANRDHYRRPKELKLSPGAENQKATALLRA